MGDNHFSHPVPLNIGYIASYALTQITDLRIRLFKHPGVLLKAVSEKKPDVLAFSNYAWNSNLNFAIAKRCKEYHPNLQIIMGGPDFPVHDTEDIKEFFLKRPFLDLYLTTEGEQNFFVFMQLFLKNGARIKNINFSDCPSTFYGFDQSKKTLLNNPLNRIDDVNLDEIPSPYLTGLMDPFLDNKHLVPIFETQRGCPYSCAFCVWGQVTRSRLRQFDMKISIDEIGYACERSANLTKAAIIADGNFGMLKRDIKIAQALMDSHAKYGYPSILYVYAAKEPRQHTFEAFEIISPIVPSMSMSLQSMNPKVLGIIGRKNISNKKYEDNIRECRHRNLHVYAELIYNLPGETFQSYLEGVNNLYNYEQERIDMPIHLMLQGAQTSSQAFRKTYGFKTAFRLQQAAMGSYEGIHSAEYEEIVIETNQTTFNDYLNIRDFHLLALLFSYQLFSGFRRALRYGNHNIAWLASTILSDEPKWPPFLTEVMATHRHLVSNEIIPIDECKLEFTDEDIRKLKGRKALLMKPALYKLFAHRLAFEELYDYIVDILQTLLKERLAQKEVEEICQALRCSMDLAVCYDDMQQSRKKEYDYDFDAWLNSEPPLPLSEFRSNQPVKFKLTLPEGLSDAFEKAKQVSTSLEDAIFSLKYSYFPLSRDRIFYCDRIRLQ